MIKAWDLVWGWLVLMAIIMLLSGCGARVFGKLTCDGKCELVIDREIRELDPVPIEIPGKKD